MAVEWGRRPYSTVARFHTGDGAPLVKIKWFVTTKPFQQFPSAINSLDWEEDWTYRRIIGEQPRRDRKYNGLWSMPGLVGDHQCGQRDQFVTGVPWPVTESNPLDPDGIPLCCGRAMVSHAYAGAVAAGQLGSVPLMVGSACAGAHAAGLLGVVGSMESQITAGAHAAGLLALSVTLTGEATAGAVAAGLLGIVRPLDGLSYAGAHAAGDLESVLPPPPPPFGSWSRDVQGDYTFTAEVTGDHLIRCWGGGGGGGLGTDMTSLGGGGGGGGAFSEVVLSLVSGTDYLVRVAAGGVSGGAAGGDTWFKIGSVIFCLGAGGQSSSLTPPAIGGRAADCIGTTAYDGGDGWDGMDMIGGGGGASAGPLGTGSSATDQSGAVAIHEGGNGGDGGGFGLVGGSGFGPGGGAGGDGNGNGDMAFGADGLIAIAWPPS